ncbi:hypothetical protein D031_4036A, partial [Vibrio parahaemolyticus VP-48]
MVARRAHNPKVVGS